MRAKESIFVISVSAHSGSAVDKHTNFTVLYEKYPHDHILIRYAHSFYEHKYHCYTHMIL